MPAGQAPAAPGKAMPAGQAPAAPGKAMPAGQAPAAPGKAMPAGSGSCRSWKGDACWSGSCAPGKAMACRSGSWPLLVRRCLLVKLPRLRKDMARWPDSCRSRQGHARGLRPDAGISFEDDPEHQRGTAITGQVELHRPRRSPRRRSSGPRGRRSTSRSAGSGYQEDLIALLRPGFVSNDQPPRSAPTGVFCCQSLRRENENAARVITCGGSCSAAVWPETGECSQFVANVTRTSFRGHRPVRPAMVPNEAIPESRSLAADREFGPNGRAHEQGYTRAGFRGVTDGSPRR